MRGVLAEMTKLSVRALVAAGASGCALLFGLPAAVLAGPSLPPVPSPSVPSATVPVSVDNGVVNVTVGPVHQSVPIPQVNPTTQSTAPKSSGAGHSGAGAAPKGAPASNHSVTTNSQVAAQAATTHSLGDSAMAAANLVTGTPGGTPTAAFILLLLSGFLLIRRASMATSVTPEARWIR